MDTKRLDELLAATEGHQSFHSVIARLSSAVEYPSAYLEVYHKVDNPHGVQIDGPTHKLINNAPAFRAAVIALREENRRLQLLTPESIKAIAPGSPYQHNGAVWVCGGCVTTGQLEDAVRLAKGAKDAE